MAGKAKGGAPHAHGCRSCKTRYEDSCSTPERNGKCPACNGGKPWQLLIDNRKPKDCCRDTSRLANKAEVAAYSLGGDTPWFICRTCARTQVYDPSRN